MNGFVLLLFCLLPFATAIYHGDLIQWNRHGYVVKVMVQDKVDNSTTACTGTLISPTSVLTSSRCFLEGREHRTVCIVLHPDGKEMKLGATSIFTEGDFAIVKIYPIKNMALCPLRPIPIRVSRLPLGTSLSEPAWQPIDIEMLQEAKCRIVGFESVNDANQYVKNNKTMQLDVKLVNDGDGIMKADDDEGRSACWDDTGLPLECNLNIESEWIQVGLLHSVTMMPGEGDDEPNEQEEMNEEEKNFMANAGVKPIKNQGQCKSAETMRFAVFYDNTMARLIEKADRLGVLATHEKCTYNLFNIENK